MTTKVLCYFTDELIPVNEAVRVTLVDPGKAQERIQVFTTKAAVGDWITESDGDIGVTYNEHGGYEVQM